MNAVAYGQMEEGPPWFQLIEGNLVQDPSPNPLHQLVSSELGYLLMHHCRAISLGKVLFAPLDIWLAEDTVLQPDILFISNRRQGIIADNRVCGAPDLVIEILSPASAQRDLGQKRAIYSREGVREYWVVDPAQQRVHLFRFGGTGTASESIVSGNQTFDSPLFPGLRITVAAIFRNV